MLLPTYCMIGIVLCNSFSISFKFPRLSVHKLSSRSRIICSKKPKLRISEWAKSFNGFIIQKNGVMSLEEHPTKPSRIAQEIKEKPKKKIALLIKAGESGTTIGNCQITHFIRMVMAYKAINYTVFPYKKDQRPGWLRHECLNEEPCFMHDGRMYYDPYIISRHLEFFYPQTSIAVDVPHVTELCKILSTSMTEFLLNQEEEDDRQLRESVLKVLETVDVCIGSIKKEDGSCYIGGGSCLGISDCSLSTLLYQLDVAGRHFKQFEIPSTLESLLHYKSTLFLEESFKATAVAESEVVWGWAQSIKSYNSSESKAPKVVPETIEEYYIRKAIEDGEDFDDYEEQNQD